MKLELLGAHQSETPSTRPTALLANGHLAIDVGGLAGGLDLASQKQIMSVLLTHSHYDHVKDLPTLVHNTFDPDQPRGGLARIITHTHVQQLILNSLFAPEIFFDPDGQIRQALKDNFQTIESNMNFTVENYQVIAVPAYHTVPAVGYQVTDTDGRSFFYSGDTERLDETIWNMVSPDVLVTEVTYVNETSNTFGHLTPERLKHGLALLRKMGKPIPNVLVIHTGPRDSSTIGKQLLEVERSLGISIELGQEGQVIEI